MKRAVCFWFLLCFCTGTTQGQINATVRQNVTLTCRVPNNINFTVVKWSRADLGEEYVLLNRDGHLEPHDQHPSFKNRVELKDGQMEDGDVSLILKDVTINDTGTYECWIFKNDTHSWELITSIYLVVVGPPGPGGAVGLLDLIIAVPVPAVLLVVAAGGFFFYRKHKEPQSQNLNPTQAQTEISPSSFQLNSESPAAVPLLSVVTEH